MGALRPGDDAARLGPTTSAEWTEVEIPLERFPTATPGIIGGLAFGGAGCAARDFRFEIDDVEIRSSPSNGR